MDGWKKTNVFLFNSFLAFFYKRENVNIYSFGMNAVVFGKEQQVLLQNEMHRSEWIDHGFSFKYTGVYYARGFDFCEWSTVYLNK